MTGFLHEKEFSRKTFLKGGGALIVGFSLAGAGFAGKAQAASSPFTSSGVDHNSVDSWIAINADNTAKIMTGGIRQGTGSDTGLLMIAGEELDMDLGQLEFVIADTAVTPNTGTHSASNTIKNAGPSVRTASATAAQALRGFASTRLGVPAAQLTVSKGVVSGGGKSVTYGELVGGKLFNVRIPDSYLLVKSSGFGFGDVVPGGLAPGVFPAKPVDQYKLVGTSQPRIDIPAIVRGTEVYIQNIRLPGMLHGRVVRPRGQAVAGFGAKIVSVDESSIQHIPGARVVRKGNFLGVVAPHEYDAIQAAAQLKVKWETPPAVLPGNGNEFEAMRDLDSAARTVWGNEDLDGVKVNNGNVDTAMKSAAHVVSHTYGWASNAHSPMGPNCAVADVTPQGARIFSGTQGAYATRTHVANVLGIPETQVRVTAASMGGCFGDGCQYFDTAQAAALMSQIVKVPVRVQLMRWDELAWTQTAPASLLDIRAGVDAKGNLIGYDFTHFYPQYWNNDVQMTEQLAGKPVPSNNSDISGNFWPGAMYNLPNDRYVVKSIPLTSNWLRAFWMRGGAAPATTWASEQVIDQLAYMMKMDPVAFRRQNVTLSNDLGAGHAKDQLLAVLDAVTGAAEWKPRVTASNLSDANVVTGRGIAWSNTDTPTHYAQTAAIADIELNKKTGKITVEHVWEAVSAGLGVSIDGIANQIIGGVTQILSRLLVEQYRYSRTAVTSADFVSYPLLRFKDAPMVTPIVIQRPNLPTLGVGEPVAGAAAAAVANALFDATGVRVHTTPLSPPRVRVALTDAGVA